MSRRPACDTACKASPSGLAASARVERTIVVVLLWLASPGSFLLGGGARPPRLCVEYLPVILHEDEPITVCVRVESEAEKPQGFRLAVSLRGAEGRALESSRADGTAGAGAAWRHHCELRIRSRLPATLEVLLSGANGGAELARLTVSVLHARTPLPRLWVKGMRLVDGSGRRVVVRIEHRVRKPDERWPLVRWFRHKFCGDRWAFRRVLLVGDDLGAPRDGYLARLAAATRSFKTSVVGVPSDTREPSPPVLRAVATLTRAALAEPPDLAVLCLGHCDADYGTDVSEFGRALELLIQQLEVRGCRQFVVVAPVGPSHLRKRLEPYAKAAKRTAFTYRAGFVDLAGRMRDKCWAGTDGRLVLRLPNARGHRVLADALARHLEKIRR